MKAQPLITTCPNGCKVPLQDSALPMPEGALRFCPACGQMVSSCSAEQYVASNSEWDTEAGTWPSEKDMRRLRKRRTQTIRAVAGMLGKNYPDIRLLDVGCSSGAFVWIAQNMGLHVEGVEPTEKPVAKARERSGLANSDSPLSVSLAQPEPCRSRQTEEQAHEKDEKESRTGIQGQGGNSRDQGRQDTGGVG